MLALRCDVGDPAQVAAAFAETVRALGRVDACFANAGISGGRQKPFLEHEVADWERVLRVNLTGAFSTLQTAARHMVERGGGGSLVGTASIAAIEGAARNQHYAASKGGARLHDPRARGRAGAARHPRQRHPAGLDRDGDDGALRRRRAVPQRRPAAHPDAPLGQGRRISAASPSTS